MTFRLFEIWMWVVVSAIFFVGNLATLIGYLRGWK